MLHLLSMVTEALEAERKVLEFNLFRSYGLFADIVFPCQLGSSRESRIPVSTSGFQTRLDFGESRSVYTAFG